MAISNADILAAVNENLGLSLSGTAIDAMLCDVLEDLTGRGNFLADSRLITTEANKGDYTLAADCKSVVRVLCGGEELEAVDASEVDRAVPGRPEGWVRWDRTLWIYPIPDGAYTLTVEMVRIHPRTADAIELGDRFFKALKAGVTAEVARSKERYDAAAAWDAEYAKALAVLDGSQIRRRQNVRYRDL